MKKNKLFNLIAIFVLIQLSSCADPAFSDLDAALNAAGQKLDRGYSRTGAFEGRSFWTFDGSDLKVEYTLKMNMTIEQQLLDNGRLERAIEEYTIENLKPSYTYDEDRKEVRKGYWGDWGNARFYFGLEHSEKGYQIKFNVQWSNGNAWCSYTHYLSEEDKVDILKRFLIKDEADENYIAAKEKLIRELNDKRASDLKADKEELENTFQFLGYPKKYYFDDKSLFFIDEFNATLNGSSVDGYVYLDENNQKKNLITIDNEKQITVAQFKKDLVSFIEDKVNNLTGLEYLYVAREDGNSFYYYPNYPSRELSELGVQYRNKFLEYKSNIMEKIHNKMNWNDIYLILAPDDMGVIMDFIYKYNKNSRNEDVRRSYGVGNVYFSSYNTSLDYSPYSLHDKISIFAQEYVLLSDGSRWSYRYTLEDFIGYCTSEYLQRNRVSDFTFSHANPDSNYIAIKLSSNDKILSKLNLKRDEESINFNNLTFRDD
jgi:hypothetical protein